MYFLLFSRNELLALFPKGGRVAEIGTNRGEFSEKILKTCEPDTLFLIDPWEHQAREDYAKDPANVSDEEHEDNLALVKKRLGPEIDRGRVEILRMYSSVAAATFEKESLDWVYIDGIHTFDGVWADLTNYAPLVKEGGFIAGHDYTNDPIYAGMGFGVVEAVNKFAVEFEYEIICLTFESVSTYVLVKDRESPTARNLVTAILTTVPAIEITDFPGRGFQVKNVHLPGGQVRNLHSF